MALQVSPFPNGFVAGLHAVGWAFILPCFWFLDRLIAVSKSTTLEQTERLEQECYLHPLKVFFGSIIFFILFLTTAPLAFLGFLLWAPLQACRRPFYYHRQTPSSPEKETHRGFELVGKASFVFATANLCLLPDSLARFNNLGHTQHRATAIGQRIVQGVCRPHIRIFVDSPSSCGTLSPSTSILSTVHSSTYGATDRQAQHPVSQNSDSAEHVSISKSNSHVVCVPCDDTEGPSTESPSPLLNSNQHSNQQGRSGHRSAPRPLLSQGLRQQDDVPWEVSSLFPANVDIMCLEEVFDKRAAQTLTQALSPMFGHILYDIGVYACQPPCRCSSFKFFNSGLFLASRFPVLEAQYHCFPNSRGEDALASKGLLSAKVLIGQNQKQKKVVGYFNCTHLHAPEGEGDIRCEQLNMVTKWIGDFQAANRQPDEDVVFDVLCGDFNFDNCSPDDTLEQNHCLFEEYRDPCRAAPGKEKPWVIGTLLEQPTLYEDDVNTPENLQRTLEREELRKQYISRPVPAEGSPLVYPETGQPWVGRRIDYILYRESSISEHCRIEIEEVTFITQLAGLTDHIPVGLRLNVIMDSDCADE
ncbi:sphingomyelin phosphodiesterase 5 isoform X1 [Xiphias gladius]|uniref:sphingomyelin phosphodiesterase 5 isoform X1 n=1 Tax=Xiphias gladius TaxID=8245 RepID=UPI001A98D2EA|nr:sphingomyelin phosphodiesterase 5 isoform X1 [Xiphias gladius]XP_039972669.1 sphingomyelin phosphodiesterase 5 isoform X1 [Xiphias gladius]XP_039972670.1 sphingomyelin phosphodiesterase 5 isoform X1 [Xiphias gladius]XP_039972671.1 sphingomyelin phosphodiesterase 5 isoform X1 [Xiphias gladius]XP_039972672.1 sphingomyelin phosphodiesterase 5 isoform X1 [Xiphias gladius]